MSRRLQQPATTFPARLALMKFADRIPFRSLRFDASATLIGVSRSSARPICHHTIVTSTISLTTVSSLRLSRGNARSINAAARPDCPRDARHFIGERHSHDQCWSPHQKPRGPGHCRRAVARKAQNRGGTNDQELSDVRILLFGDSAQLFLPAARTLPRNETEPENMFCAIDPYCRNLQGGQFLSVGVRQRPHFGMPMTGAGAVHPIRSPSSTPRPRSRKKSTPIWQTPNALIYICFLSFRLPASVVLSFRSNSASAE